MSAGQARIAIGGRRQGKTIERQVEIWNAAIEAAAQDTEAVADQYAGDKEDPGAARVCDIMRGRADSIRLLKKRRPA